MKTAEKAVNRVQASNRKARSSKPVRTAKPIVLDPHDGSGEIETKEYGSRLQPEMSFPGLERQLYIKGRELYLGHSLKRGGLCAMVPCTFVQAVAWCKAMRALAPQRGWAEAALLDYAATYLVKP